MKIRYATNDDAELLSEIGGETFWDTYHEESILDQNYIKTHIENTFNSEQMKSELDNEKIIYLIAENDLQAVGYVRLLNGSSRKEISGQKPIEISRIYLRKDFLGQKLGEKLIERCIKEAEKHDCEVIWLSVWKYNERAIHFYEKFGFYNVGEHFFDLAGSPQIDYLMQKDLS